MTAPVAKAADTLLAARTAPWVDLLSPKAPAGAGPAQAVLNASRVDNDVLLPQGHALRASPQSAAGEPARAALPGAPVRTASSSTDLSTAARLIQTLLADLQGGESGPVRGQAPVWPAARQIPHAAALASALSQQVSQSGLFYESHLAQFAAGTRSLAQMQREPQAGLSRQPADGIGVQPAQAATPQQAQRSGPSAQLLPVAAPQAQAAAMPAPATASPLVAAASLDMQQVLDASGADAMQAMPRHEDAAGPRQPHPQPGGMHAASHAAQADSSSARSADAAPVAQRAPAATTAPDPAATAVVHPQAAPLVHQQLDLLASAMFRWSGEAWPGVKMEWTVQEEGGGAPAEGEAQPPAQWSTALSLELPRLGRVDLRMKLSGTSVRAQLAAPQRDALTQLRVHRSGLSQRLAAAGFELRALELDAELAA